MRWTLSSVIAGWCVGDRAELTDNDGTIGYASGVIIDSKSSLLAAAVAHWCDQGNSTFSTNGDGSPSSTSRGRWARTSSSTLGESWPVYENGTRDRVIFSLAGLIARASCTWSWCPDSRPSRNPPSALTSCLEAFGGSPKEWVFDKHQDAAAVALGRRADRAAPPPARARRRPQGHPDLLRNAFRRAEGSIVSRRRRSARSPSPCARRGACR